VKGAPDLALDDYFRPRLPGSFFSMLSGENISTTR
jgi:hypothetical protein